MSKQKTLSLRPDTYEKLADFKKFVNPDGSFDSIIDYLLNSNPRMKDYLTQEKEKQLIGEFIKVNMANPTISWEDFKESRKSKDGKELN
jgi:predicted CopG family antitoxin